MSLLPLHRLRGQFHLRPIHLRLLQERCHSLSAGLKQRSLFTDLSTVTCFQLITCLLHLRKGIGGVCRDPLGFAQLFFQLGALKLGGLLLSC
eukprot:Skav208327  [mRNA]  locus=scaffold1961:49429:58940:- [translate_table: standard]